MKKLILILSIICLEFYQTNLLASAAISAKEKSEAYFNELLSALDGQWGTKETNEDPNIQLAQNELFEKFLYPLIQGRHNIELPFNANTNAQKIQILETAFEKLNSFIDKLLNENELNTDDVLYSYKASIAFQRLVESSDLLNYLKLDLVTLSHVLVIKATYLSIKIGLTNRIMLTAALKKAQSLTQSSSYKKGKFDKKYTQQLDATIEKYHNF